MNLHATIKAAFCGLLLSSCYNLAAEPAQQAPPRSATAITRSAAAVKSFAYAAVATLATLYCLRFTYYNGKVCLHEIKNHLDKKNGNSVIAENILARVGNAGTHVLAWLPVITYTGTRALKNLKIAATGKAEEENATLATHQ